MAIQFDTLRYVEKLKSASIPEAQAKAKAEALATVLGKATSGLLATKDDITDIKFGIADVKTDPKLINEVDAHHPYRRRSFAGRKGLLLSLQ